MAESPQNSPPVKDWRIPLAIGLGIGLGGGVSRGVESNLEPSLGYWGAFAISIVAASFVGGLVAWLVYLLIKPRGGNSK